MKHISHRILASLSLFALVPLVASAQLDTGSNSGELAIFGEQLVTFIGDTLVPLVFAVTFVLFIYGVYLYFIAGGGEDDKRKTGRDYMLWAILAVVVMVSVWGITQLIANGLGFGGDPLDDGIIPNLPGATGGGDPNGVPDSL